MALDEIDFPDAWLEVLLPRRSGRSGTAPSVPEDEVAGLEERRRTRAGEIEEIVQNPMSDPSLVTVLSEDGTAAEGVRLALESGVLNWWGPALAMDSVERLGLVEAAAAWVEAAAVRVVYGHQLARDGRGMAMVRVDAPVLRDREDVHPSRLDLKLIAPIRRLLSAADETTWDAAVQRLAPYRNGTWEQRLTVCFLLPDRRDWVDADLAELSGVIPGYARAELIGCCGYDEQQFSSMVIDELADAATVVDALGTAAVPLLLRSLDWFFVDKGARSTLLDVLAHVPTRATLDGLLARADKADVPEAFEGCAARAPQAALAALESWSEGPFSAALRARLLVAHPQLVPDADFDSGPPLLSVDDAPKILTTPPWTLPKAPTVTVHAPALGERIEWLDGERETWSWDPWQHTGDPQLDDSLRQDPGWARFYIGGSDAAVRPLLAEWEAEKSSFYLLNPRVLVAKYELDAYPPVLRLARAKPVVGAELLLPYLSDEVAQLMGRWLATSRQYAELARNWFERHGPAAVAALVPVAVGKPTVEASTTALALSKLDPELVRSAGRLLGANEAVEGLLSRDPLQLIPGKVPSVPRWLALDCMPAVRSLDRRGRLGEDEVRALVQMIALSDPRDPYPGLASVAAELDADSLAEFAWALFSHWHICGYASKDAWAMNALGYFGNTQVADRLASLVARWPTDGMAQRAKRGAELLAMMETPAGLQHLSRIARSAKSTPLRSHASAILGTAAAERGLLPEQLDDLLADDLGLETDEVSYRGVAYRVRVGPALDLVGEDSAGTSSARCRRRRTTPRGRSSRSGTNGDGLPRP